MKLAVVMLWIVCVSFVGFGLVFALAPEQAAELVTDAAPSTPSGLTDMRATYGGVAFGLGVFAGLCARRRDWVRVGLVVSLLVVASLATARTIGIIVDGSPNGFMFVNLGLEVGSAVLLIVALRGIPDTPRS